MNWLLTVIGSVLIGLAGGAMAQSPPPDKAKVVTLDTDPRLVGWWKFDETTGKQAADASAKPHPGALEGGLSFDTNSVPGRMGAAIKLDGKDGFVRIADWKGVSGPRPRTIAAWIKATAASGSIVTWGAEEPGRMWTFGFVRGRIGVDPKGGYLYMKAPTHDDTWHHVAVVVREAAPPNLHDDVKLFKDGELAEIDDIGLLDLWPIDTGDKREVMIGRRFKGLIDDVRIYDRALAEDEIMALFKQQGDRPLKPEKKAPLL
jgi:hypothetical protein